MGTAALIVNVPHTTVPAQFSEIYQRYADVVYRAALRVTGSPADAEDVLQTVFLRLLNRDDLAETARAPEAYFRRAATNAAIDVIRRRASRAERAVDEQLSAPPGPPLLKERLRRAIAQLQPRDAELFALRYIEGVSNSELAEMLGMERVTVGTRLHRIRRMLQESLGQ